jgi:hypothetical protein
MALIERIDKGSLYKIKQYAAIPFSCLYPLGIYYEPSAVGDTKSLKCVIGLGGSLITI